MNFEWLPRNQYIFYQFENIMKQTRKENANFPTSFIEFRHWMKKLQHFKLDF